MTSDAERVDPGTKRGTKGTDEQSAAYTSAHFLVRAARMQARPAIATATLHAPREAGKLGPKASAKLADLGRVAKAHPEFPVLVVSHDARPGAKDDGLASQAVEAMKAAGAVRIATAFTLHVEGDSRDAARVIIARLTLDELQPCSAQDAGAEADAQDADADIVQDVDADGIVATLADVADRIRAVAPDAPSP